MLKSLIVVHVGTNDSPANKDDVEKVKLSVGKFFESKSLPLIPVVLRSPCDINLFPSFFVDDMEVRVIHAKVGNEDQRCYDEDIEEARATIQSAIDDNSLPYELLVTAYDVTIDVFPPIECE